MQLNQSEESGSRLGHAFRICIQVVRRVTVFLFWALIVSAITTAIIMFGRIVWCFLLILLKALGES